MSKKNTIKHTPTRSGNESKGLRTASGVLENRLLKALRALAWEAYPSSDLSSLTVEFSHEDYRTFHGDYDSRLKRIRITNLYRDKLQLICCAVHELAHALQDVMGLSIGHGREFYVIYYNLLQCACKTGMLDRENLKQGFDDERSLSKVIRLIGPITMLPDPLKLYGKGTKLIVAFNAYDVKDVLKKRGYFYNPRSRAWEYEIPEDIVDEEVYYISSLNVDVNVTGLLDITTFTDIVVTGNTYKYRELLSANRFRYDRITHKWTKKVLSTDRPQEDLFIRKLNDTKDISVTITY